MNNMIKPDRLYIVNCVDRPDPRHVAELRGTKLHYIAIAWPPMPLTVWATPLADFGFVFQQTKRGLLCMMPTDTSSRAKYPNGELRGWQGERAFIVKPDAIEIFE